MNTLSSSLPVVKKLITVKGEWTTHPSKS